MFEIILSFVYSNKFPSSLDLEEVFKSLGPEFNGSQYDANRVLGKHLKLLEIPALVQHIQTINESLESSFNKNLLRYPRLDRNSFPQLQDVIIKCENNEEFSAHKCVLIGKADYFNAFFMHSWSEQNVINLSTISIDYMLPMIDFLYNVDEHHFRKQNHQEPYLYQMITICDQFFVERLKNLCEILILDKITIRKCGEMLEFANTYNCELLKDGCLKFICQNLSRVLIKKSLDNCDPEFFKDINSIYKTMFKKVFDYRMITPHSKAIDDELLSSFIDNFQVDLNYEMVEDNDPVLVEKRKRSDSENCNSKRQYEKEAILSMKKLSVEDAPKPSVVETVKKEDPINWMKVAKPVLKKKEVQEIAAPVVVKSPESESQSTHSSLNLGDFNIIKGGKLSQQQRKKLSKSESIPTPQTTPIAEPIVSPWGTVSPSTSSPIDIRRRRKSSGSEPPSSLSASFGNSSFNQILEEEVQQKQYYNKMRSKSLHLTQIEETAINELRDFYNVDNVFDEIITIGRTPTQKTMNFAVWQKN